MNASSPSKHTAIIVGGSIAGLLAAEVLSRHYRRVLILESDRIGPMAAPRKGTPQDRHSHALLPSGMRTIERLLPGTCARLLEAGGVAGNAERFRWHDGGGLHQRVPDNGEVACFVSRNLLEHSIRERVLTRPNVVLRDGYRALGLVHDQVRQQVTGCRFTLAEGPGHSVHIEACDLLVDASGRCNRSARWLTELGYPPVASSEVQLSVRYATGRFRRDPGDLDGDHGAVLAPHPERGRGAVLLAQEADSWTLTLIGVDPQEPPLDEAGFQAYARSLPEPFLAALCSGGRALGEIERYVYNGSARRHFERADLPQGLLVLGDALCSFNPIYGQGISVAAMQASALADTLGGLDSADDPAWIARFHQRAARLLEQPWRIVAEGDLRFPQARGARSPTLRFAHWYLERVHRAARRDVRVAQAFRNVSFLQAPVAHLLSPPLAWRILRS